MAEQDSDVTDATPSQEALSVTGAAQQLLDRFPEKSGTESDPKPAETEDLGPAAEAVETEDADPAGLEDEPDETPKAPSLHKVQVDGVETEITLDEALLASLAQQVAETSLLGFRLVADDDMRVAAAPEVLPPVVKATDLLGEIAGEVGHEVREGSCVLGDEEQVGVLCAALSYVE